MTVHDAARRLIRNAYVDGGHCLDAVSGPDMARLAKAIGKRAHLRGGIEAAALDLANWYADHQTINWGRLERLHRAVLVAFPDVHAGR